MVTLTRRVLPLSLLVKEKGDKTTKTIKCDAFDGFETVDALLKCINECIRTSDVQHPMLNSVVSRNRQNLVDSGSLGNFLYQPTY